MCKLPTIILRLLAGIACLLACSCFDIREEVWIEHDGSGRAVLSYLIPTAAAALVGGNDVLKEKIREAIVAQPKLRLDDVSVLDEGDRTKVEVKISTDSVLSLRHLDESESFNSMPAAAVDLAGKFDVHLRGLNVDFSRTVRVREALGLATLAIRGNDRQNRRITYIFHLPTPSLESNATSVQDGGKTLVWDSTLGEALQKPLVTRFKARMPIPRMAWFATGLVGIVLIGLLLRLRASRRRKLAGES